MIRFLMLNWILDCAIPMSLVDLYSCTLGLGCVVVKVQ